MYLLDTVVISELRKRTANPNVLLWMTHVEPSDIHLSVLSLMEIERGVALIRRKEPARAVQLENWIEQVVASFGDAILPLTAGIARRWGKLEAELGHESVDLGLAASAIEHGLTFVTRNVRHFNRTGVTVIDPFVAP